MLRFTEAFHFNGGRVVFRSLRNRDPPSSDVSSRKQFKALQIFHFAFWRKFRVIIITSMR